MANKATKDKQTKVKMDSNPNKVAWPTDKWGFTRELRKAILITASKLKGDADKKRLLDETLEIGIEFLEVNYASGLRTRRRALEKLAAQAADVVAVKPAKSAPKEEPDEQMLFDFEE